jgi:hypothetical protein
MYVKADSDHQIIKFPYTIDDFREEYKNVSMPLHCFNTDVKLMESYGLAFVRSDPPPVYDPENQTCIQFARPTYSNGQWVREWQVKDIPESVKEARLKEATERQVEMAKATRNRLLSASDWTQVADVPAEVQKKYKSYRKKLRDITSQKGFPFDIKWPEVKD